MRQMVKQKDLEKNALHEDEMLRKSFLRYLRAEGIAPTTIRRYDLTVREFQEFARAMGFPRVVTREHVTHFLAQRRESRAPNTARNDQMALSRYFKWLVEEGELNDNPLANVKAPPVQEHIPNPYSDDELKGMLKACRGTHFESRRNAAILWVLLDTGLRAGEFCKLMVEDIDLDRERILVRGKRGRERFVRLGYKAQLAVDRYLRVRNSIRPELWLNKRGQPLTPGGLYQAVERICASASVAAPSIHRFRHYAATKMRDLGIQDQELMDLMGWTVHRMAQRYTQSTAKERALRAHRKYSPGDNLSL